MMFRALPRDTCTPSTDVGATPKNGGASAGRQLHNAASATATVATAGPRTEGYALIEPSFQGIGMRWPTATCPGARRMRMSIEWLRYER